MFKCCMVFEIFFKVILYSKAVRNMFFNKNNISVEKKIFKESIQEYGKNINKITRIQLQN